MSEAAPQAESESAPTHPLRSGLGGKVVLGIFLGVLAVTLADEFGNFRPIQGQLNTAFVLLALLASIVALSPPLAWPNVLLAAGLAAALGGLTQAVSAATGFPFGQLEFTTEAGPRLFGLIPWWLPLVWPLMALSARGTARLVLRRSREHPRHGYHVILLATGLAIVLMIAFHAFAVRGGHLWLPGTFRSGFILSGVVLHLIIQVAMTPLLIDKFPGARPPNFRPLLVWASLNAFVVAGIFRF